MIRFLCSAVSFLFVGTIAFTVFTAIIRWIWRRGEWYQAVARVGQRYRALPKQRLAGRPSLYFGYGKARCTLDYPVGTVGDGGMRTRLSIHWLTPKFRFYLSTIGPPPRSWRNRKLKRVGGKKFASLGECYFFTDSVPFSHKLLNDGALLQIRQLIESCPEGLEIRMERGTMTISRQGHVKSFQPLDDFVRLGLGVYDQFCLVMFSQEIAFINTPKVRLDKDVKCPVCSERIQKDVAICVRCQTPHCADCWEYNGECATFACRETRCRRLSQTGG